MDAQSDKVKGRLKEAAGDLTGNKRLKRKGQVDLGSLLGLLRLLHLDAGGLPGGPVTGHQCPQRERGNIGHAADPVGEDRDGDHEEPEDREPSVHSPHEDGVSLNGGPERFDEFAHGSTDRRETVQEARRAIRSSTWLGPTEQEHDEQNDRNHHDDARNDDRCCNHDASSVD